MFYLSLPVNSVTKKYEHQSTQTITIDGNIYTGLVEKILEESGKMRINLVLNSEASIRKLDADHDKSKEDMRKMVYEAIDRERAYQYNKWGENPHDIGGWITIIQHRLDEARSSYCERGYNFALEEILKVATTAIACLEEHGIVERQ